MIVLITVSSAVIAPMALAAALPPAMLHAICPPIQQRMAEDQPTDRPTKEQILQAQPS